MREECLICNAPLEYLQEDVMMECAVCHKKENSNAKASELSLGLFDDNSTTPIETVKVDDLNRDTSGKVYSVSGVLVKNNAADLNNLPKGIYVVNGKKYVVK